MNNKIKILIADDEEFFIQALVETLIPHFQVGETTEEFLDFKMQKAKELFEIKEVKWAHQAVNIVKSGYSPDIAFIDLSFDKNSTATDSPILLNKELALGSLTQLGYLIEETIKLHCKNCDTYFITENVIDKQIVGKAQTEKKYVLNHNLFAKNKSGKGTEFVEDQLVEILKRVSSKYLSKLKIKKAVTDILKNYTDNDLDKIIGGITLKSLVAYCFKIKYDDQLKQYICSPENAKRELQLLLKLSNRKLDFNPKGVFKSSILLKKFDQSFDDYNFLQTVDMQARDFIFEFANLTHVFAYDSKTYLTDREKYAFLKQPVKNFIYRETDDLNDLGPMVQNHIIKYVAIVRKIFIGMSYLHDKQMFPFNKTKDAYFNSFLSFALNAIENGHAYQAPIGTSKLKKYFTTFLGLSLRNNQNGSSFSIDYSKPTTRDQERIWMLALAGEIDSKHLSGFFPIETS